MPPEVELLPDVQGRPDAQYQEPCYGEGGLGSPVSLQGKAGCHLRTSAWRSPRTPVSSIPLAGAERQVSPHLIKINVYTLASFLHTLPAHFGSSSGLTVARALTLGELARGC